MSLRQMSRVIITSVNSDRPLVSIVLTSPVVSVVWLTRAGWHSCRWQRRDRRSGPGDQKDRQSEQQRRRDDTGRQPSRPRPRRRTGVHLHGTHWVDPGPRWNLFTTATTTTLIGSSAWCRTRCPDYRMNTHSRLLLTLSLLIHAELLCQQLPASSPGRCCRSSGDKHT